MKKLILLISFLLFSHYSAQSKVERLSKITEGALKLYVKDTLKRPIKDGDNIAISMFSDSISNKSNLYIETLDKDFKLYKNTTHYKWFKFQEKNVIVFCGFNSTNKCQKYFESLNFQIDEKNYTEILNQEPTSDKLDGNTKLWNININKDYKITNINGKMIEAEIANPREFKRFLRKFSSLQLYQLDEGGELIDIKR